MRPIHGPVRGSRGRTRPARRRGFDRLNHRVGAAAVRRTGSRLIARSAPFDWAQDKRCSTNGVRRLLGVRMVSTDRSLRLGSGQALRSLLDQHSAAARPAGGVVSTSSTTVGCGCFSAYGVSTDRSLRSLLDQRWGAAASRRTGPRLTAPFDWAQDKRSAPCSTSTQPLLDQPAAWFRQAQPPWGCGCLRRTGSRLIARFARCSTSISQSLLDHRVGAAACRRTGSRLIARPGDRGTKACTDRAFASGGLARCGTGWQEHRR